MDLYAERVKLFIVFFVFIAIAATSLLCDVSVGGALKRAIIAAFVFDIVGGFLIKMLENLLAEKAAQYEIAPKERGKK